MSKWHKIEIYDQHLNLLFIFKFNTFNIKKKLTKKNNPILLSKN